MAVLSGQSSMTNRKQSNDRHLQSQSHISYLTLIYPDRSLVQFPGIDVSDHF